MTAIPAFERLWPTIFTEAVVCLFMPACGVIRPAILALTHF
jgi:hypothetical protein